MLNRDVYLASDSKKIADSAEGVGYSRFDSAFKKEARLSSEAGNAINAELYTLFSNACSMMLEPISVNEPLKPFYVNYQEGKRSPAPEDFTTEELDFFESILGDIHEPWLKARLADILWLSRKPKNPEHARLAISAYLSHQIDSDNWKKDVDNCYERAARLAMQLKDKKSLSIIEDKLIEAFRKKYQDDKFIILSLAKTLCELGLDKSYLAEVSTGLFSTGDELKQAGDFNGAISYFEQASKTFKKNKKETDCLVCLVHIAECLEFQGDQRLQGEKQSNLVANSCFENSIQAYRKIPVKHRDRFDVENRLKSLRGKLTKAGKGALGEMTSVSTPAHDINPMVKASIAHVSGKESVEIVFQFFAGLSKAPSYEELKKSSQQIMGQSLMSSIFGATHMSSDGRVVAKTPAADLLNSDAKQNEAAIHHQMMMLFSIQSTLTVQGQILPALEQILSEHTITLAKLEALCYYSPLVPDERKMLTATALWHGFERDFPISIHLLCPQFEHIVRIKLKYVGAQTSNVNPEGVEQENGLSALLDLPETLTVFGEDLLFEIKSVFTDPLGSNLRNEVAHGLLSDESSSSIGSIYAWWMVLRMIVRSLYDTSEREVETAAEEIVDEQ